MFHILTEKHLTMKTGQIGRAINGAGIVRHEAIQSGPKKCIHSLLINIFGINLNEISISG